MTQLAVDKFISEGNVRIDKVQKSNEDYKALKNNIKEIGIQTPITYRVNDNGDLVVINGHQRLQIAKDLKLIEIPAYESNGKVDDLTKQLSTNIFTVPMTHLDASFAIDKMVENGIVTTKKALKAKFGKNSEWVNVALAFCNLHPLIRGYFKDYDIVNNLHNCSDSLIEISKSTITQQEIVIADMIECDDLNEITQGDFSDYFEHYRYSLSESISEFLNDLASKLETDESRWKFICEVIGEETFKDYEKKADIVHEYQNSLFQEYADTQWCKDNDFLREIFLLETPIGRFISENDLPHVNNNDDWIRFDFSTKVATLKKNLTAEAGVGLKNIKITGWSGTVFHPFLNYEILENSQEPESYVDEHGEDGLFDDNKPVVDKDPHQLKYNKFNKWAAPFIEQYLLEYVNPLKCNDCDLNQVFEWIMAILDERPSFDVGWYNEEKGEGHPLEHLINRSENYSNDEVIQKMATYWFYEYYPTADFAQLDELFKEQKMASCKEYLAKVFYDGSTEDCRKDYFKIFSKDDLFELIMSNNPDKDDYSKMNKTELVEVASNLGWLIDEIPLFNLVCTNNGSGSNELKSYLK